jgi:hypothetical protein
MLYLLGFSFFAIQTIQPCFSELQNWWKINHVNRSQLLVFVICPSCWILNLENTTFRKLDLFPFSGEGGDTYSVGSLRNRKLKSPSD